MSFLAGMAFLTGLTQLSRTEDDRLFEINVFVGSAVVLMGLGGFLVVQAASALGGAGSSPFLRRVPWLLLPLFPLALLSGQVQANDPGRLPWAFPFVNLVVVGVPSLLIASLAITRYTARNPIAWPVSWREATSGFTWGAIGATTFGGIVNTIAIYLGAALVIDIAGRGDVFDISNIDTVSTGWGIAFDLGVLSVVAPFNEEFWKGSLVALFFFRQGGLARCFCWGVLAGTGFNLFETFLNSLAAVNPEQLADQTIGGQWWLFAVARAGTCAIHGLASGFAALGFYGLLRRRWTLAPLYFAGVALHGAWNGSAYLVSGDVFLSKAGPDAAWLDATGIGALVGLGSGSLLGLWLLSGWLRDGAPAHLYRMLGMQPTETPAVHLPPYLLREAAGS